ncbi:hypothetical protein QOZ88_05830 [Blastococcus sp. BMG 814]|uniref:Uncharacterized protein n=1 Tax=Blastococcus carthaginiensis TaxID=3050034 RepID=A0ABT9I9B2_9ACTN|nr:hypothetical protein [Blastococcus carthaginiensis]MDP5182149.1 hypothetical protein [Blastococcus carthaginiensis]
MSRPRPVAVRCSRDDAWLCARRQRRGWYCARGLHVDGPCALVPRWWNVRARWRWSR